MSDVNDDDTLNEFEYSEEELAELAKLNELNDDSDELTPVPAEEETAIVPGGDSEELELDDDFVDDLLNPGEVKTEPEKKLSFEEWVKEQIWTKTFRKRFNLSITTFKRKNKKIRRNEKCECGSGLKYKKCCLNKNKEQ